MVLTAELRTSRWVDLVHRPVGSAAKFDAETLDFGDNKGPALIRDERVGWLTANRQHQLFIVVLADDDAHLRSAESADAFLAKDRVHAVPGRNAREQDLFDQRVQGGGQRRDVSFAVGGIRNGKLVGQQPLRRFGQLENIVVTMCQRSRHAAIRPPQFVAGLRDAHPAIAGMIVVANIVGQIVAWARVRPPEYLVRLPVHVALYHGLAAPLAIALEPLHWLLAAGPVE